MQTKAVVFDLDGTLLDTLADLADACNYTRAQLGLPTMEKDWYRLKLGNGAKKLVQRFLPAEMQAGAAFENAYAVYCGYYETHTSQKTEPFHEINELLAALRAEGVKLGVVSNKPDGATQAVIAHYFPHVFDAVAGKKDGYGVKPDPASLLACMQALGTTQTNTVYVGDSDVDVYTAHNAHIPCAAAAWGYRGEEELAAAGADFMLHSPLQLLRCLQ